MDIKQLRSRIDTEGFAVIPGVITPEQVVSLQEAIDNVSEDPAVRRRSEIYAMRDLFRLVPAIRELAGSQVIRRLVEPVLGPGCFPVRGLLFDKTAGANWKVVWHQDLTIAVEQQIEIEGYGPWSVKAGIPHVRPPAELLEQMLTVRLHLDDCGVENGPLRVIPGSHRSGRLGPGAVQEWRRQITEAVCEVQQGGALLMRPLLLHASSPSQLPGHRRVIHLEYAACELPGGLQWHGS